MYIFTDEEPPFSGNTVIKSLLLLLLLLLLSLGGQPFLSESTCFFCFFSTIKVNPVAKIMQSAYLSTKNHHFSRF